MIFDSALKPKLIYVFRINDEVHRGCLKIGETTYDGDLSADYFTPNSKALNESAHRRIKQYTATAGIAYELLYTECTIHKRNGKIVSFNDKEVHNCLLHSNVQRKEFDTVDHANEWFITNLNTVKLAIAAVKEGRNSLQPGDITDDTPEPIVFRPEQRDAIEMTKKVFQTKNKMLWNAKMRFGKTLSALQVVKEMGFRRTLILSHRPVVNDGWFEDFGKIFSGTDYAYGSKGGNGESNFSCLELQAKQGKLHYVWFVSMQDMRGSGTVGGKYDKNDDVFKANWDLLIIDEAHEGTKTDLGEAVIKSLQKRKNIKTLNLTGTAFNLIDDFEEDAIYTWDYIMEQRAKAQWDIKHQGDPNPYACLPKMNIWTYNLGTLMLNYEEDDEVAFNFREFFRTDEDGKFVHEADVRSFLDLMSHNSEDSLYPFSRQEYRDIFNHTLWMLPGVDAAAALKKLLETHDVFSYFHIVNVAGRGDEDVDSDKALQLVKDAVKKHPFTITLSCSRLTTGVSVPEWTAVMLLRGSATTSPSSYMQTIFRVQTPATIEGRVKDQCYVFDFAPDRTLKMLTGAVKVSTKAGKANQSDRQRIGELLNFCPVIGIQGSVMKQYDTDRLLQQLKRIYVERVVRSGFEDANIYNDELLKLDNVQLTDFENLKKIIGETRAMGKTKDIDINKQGLTNEEYEEKEKLDKKKKKQLTPEEKERLAELKKKQENRQSAISILRGISIRMPLIIYGADIENENTQLTIDNFEKLVDNESWTEFMPKGVDKKTFQKFKRYYDPDIFNAAGKRIRAMAKEADKLGVEERIERIADIFSTFRNPDKETILTPWRVVNMHIADTLGGWCFYDETYSQPIPEPRFVDHGDVTTNVFNPYTNILEINSKSGLYPLYMAYSVYKSRLAASFLKVETVDEQQALWDTVCAENVFVICKTPMARSITQRTLTGFRKTPVNAKYYPELINIIKNKPQTFIDKVCNGKSFWKRNNNNNMKFNAIVGNPPYQVMDGGTDRGAVPVYQHFVTIAKRINPIYISMIMPARWYAGGRGLDEFREELMNDHRLKNLYDYELSKYLFPSVDIAGGLCVFLWDANYDGLCNVYNKNAIKDYFSQRYLNQFQTLIRSNAAIPILIKVLDRATGYLNEKVLSINPFGFRTYFRGSTEGDIRILTSQGWAKVNRLDIKKGIEYIDQYKIIIGRFVPSNGEMSVKPGDGYRVLTEPKIIGPREINTETYIDTAVFLTFDEANNYKKYLFSKFARYLLRLGVTSVNVTKECFIYVPLQDFTSNSDIDWSRSVEEIDRQLYDKYSLTPEERDFIESMIKPMT